MDRDSSRRCAAQSAEVGEQLPGTAPEANGWIAIEQWGSYGHDALVESRFPTALGAWLKSTLARLAIKPVLIRPPGAHPENRQPGARRVFLASSRPGSAELAGLKIQQPDELYDVDYSAIASGHLADAHPQAQLDTQPLFLICSHAKRDVCCAQRGRPIATELASRLAHLGILDRVWESSHLGGHRFAPVGLQLPHGWVHGRFGVDDAATIFADAQVGCVSTAFARGRSSQSGKEQVAEIASRELNHVTSIDSVNAISLGKDRFQISAADGPRIVVKVSEEALVGQRPDSCSKAPSDTTNFSLRTV